MAEESKGRAMEGLALKVEESEIVSKLTVMPHQVGVGPSYYESFAVRGIRVDEIQPGFIVCTFRVPPRLTDASGNLSSGAIANLVDEVGAIAIVTDGLPVKVSVGMSISYLSTAKAGDELKIVSRTLGHIGGYSGTSVVLRNRKTGEVVAEGRHSLFGKFTSKL